MQTEHLKNKEIYEIPASYVILDLETTGLSSHTDQIIEIGAIKIENGVPKDHWQSLARPDFSLLEGQTLSERVSRLTGITKEMLINAPAFSELSASLMAFLGRLPIAGHRVGFDIAFLDAALFSLTKTHMENDFFDTLLLSQRLLPELIHHKLGDLAAYYHIDYTGAHRAHRDCEITYECIKAMEQTAESSFPSKEAFYKHWEFGSRRLKAEDIVTENTKFDTLHPFYQKRIVITGILSSLSRRSAMQKIADFGGSNQDKVTIFTDFLVKGAGEGTSKEKKALRLIAEGHTIQILSEEEFLRLLSL